MKPSQDPPKPLALGYDDGGDMFPADAEKALRGWLVAVAAVNNDLRARDGAPGRIRYRVGGITWTTPIPTSNPVRGPRRGESWERVSADTVAATHEAEVRIALCADGPALILAVGPPMDLATDLDLSVVDGTCIWGGRWPEVDVVIYRVGQTLDSKRWAYATRFVEHYRRVPA